MANPMKLKVVCNEGENFTASELRTQLSNDLNSIEGVIDARVGNVFVDLQAQEAHTSVEMDESATDGATVRLEASSLPYVHNAMEHY